MLPQATFTDPGNGTPGTDFAGPYVGPLTIQEVNLTFLNVTEEVELADAIVSLATGAVTAQGHDYLIAVDNVQNVVGIIKSNQSRPDTAMRTHPPLKFHPGQVIFVRSVQLSGAIEPVTLILLWKRPSGASSVVPS